MKFALSIMLVVTQVASCGAAPTYLCIARDGGVSLAFGPDDCNCCERGHHHGISCATDDSLASPLLAGSRGSHVGRHNVDACGCLHLELAHEQAPTVERASAAEQATMAVTLSVDTPVLANLACAVAIVDSPHDVAASAPVLRADLDSSAAPLVLRL